ncbi:MAG: hypothetical protein MRZ54_04100 [Clostridiales bacterium]|nr:hypothetical protein [Clostridiales bacterium]
MNPYFLFFSLLALLGTPVSLHAGMRVGRELTYQIRVQAAGLPFMRRTGEEDRSQEQPVRQEDVARTVAETDPQLVLCAVKTVLSKRLFRLIHLESVYVHARLSFDDAALTALLFAAVRTVLETLAYCSAFPGKLTGRMEADFHANGSELFVRGIFMARLGSLLYAAAVVGAAIIKARAAQARMEEETYAASH